MTKKHVIQDYVFRVISYSAEELSSDDELASDELDASDELASEDEDFDDALSDLFVFDIAAACVYVDKTFFKSESLMLTSALANSFPITAWTFVESDISCSTKISVIFDFMSLNGFFSSRESILMTK